LRDYPDRFRNRDRRLAKELRSVAPEALFAGQGETALFPGCDAVDKGATDVAKTLALLQDTSRKRVVLADIDQVCGGYPLLAAGYVDMFRWHASRVADALRPYETAVVNCSACIHTMRDLYPSEGVDLNTNIVSLPEYLAASLENVPDLPKKPRIYFHDPCHLVRDAGVWKEPRALLERVAEVRELSWSKQDTDCCGGGGLLPKTMPEVADAMARKRLRDVAQRGGGTVVTASPTCAFMLKQNAPDGVAVYDLPAYLTERLQTLTTT